MPSSNSWPILKNECGKTFFFFKKKDVWSTINFWPTVYFGQNHYNVDHSVVPVLWIAPFPPSTLVFSWTMYKKVQLSSAVISKSIYLKCFLRLCSSNSENVLIVSMFLPGTNNRHIFLWQNLHFYVFLAFYFLLSPGFTPPPSGWVHLLPCFIPFSGKACP